MNANNQYKNEEVLNFFSKNNSLLSSSLNKIDISQLNGEVIITFEFTLINKTIISLKLIGVSEYSFYHNSTSIFYNIESYKFLKSHDGQYYISLDPISENETIEQQDNDFVIAREILLCKE
jgi:hypothetical protein